MAHPESHVAYAPTRAGFGDGRSVFFFCGLECGGGDKDRALRAFSIANLGDDVAALRAAGYRVVFDLCGTKEQFVAALCSTHVESRGTQTAGFCWFGHGDAAGQVYTHAGEYFGPAALRADVARRASCALGVFGCCWVGLWQGSWRDALGGRTHVHGWKRPVSVYAGQLGFFTPDDQSEQD